VTSSTERLVVSSGVSAGDMVVVSPVRGASDGMRIQSLDEAGEVLAAYSATIEAPEEAEEGMAETETGDAEAETTGANAG
jgi:hypothetical protein